MAFLLPNLFGNPIIKAVEDKDYANVRDRNLSLSPAGRGALTSARLSLIAHRSCATFSKARRRVGSTREGR